MKEQKRISAILKKSEMKKLKKGGKKELEIDILMIADGTSKINMDNVKNDSSDGKMEVDKQTIASLFKKPKILSPVKVKDVKRAKKKKKKRRIVPTLIK